MAGGDCTQHMMVVGQWVSAVTGQAGDGDCGWCAGRLVRLAPFKARQ